jgi:hypothetical protein
MYCRSIISIFEMIRKGAWVKFTSIVVVRLRYKILSVETVLLEFEDISAASSSLFNLERYLYSLLCYIQQHHASLTHSTPQSNTLNQAQTLLVPNPPLSYSLLSVLEIKHSRQIGSIHNIPSTYIKLTLFAPSNPERPLFIHIHKRAFSRGSSRVPKSSCQAMYSITILPQHTLPHAILKTRT